jgi:hypothetical protein
MKITNVVRILVISLVLSSKELSIKMNRVSQIIPTKNFKSKMVAHNSLEPWMCSIWVGFLRYSSSSVAYLRSGLMIMCISTTQMNLIPKS